MHDLVTPNANITWQKLLPALDIPIDRNALPATTMCPFCKRHRLTSYQDSINRGVWHHCSGCDYSGDSVELAAKIWQLSLSDTLARLLAMGHNLPADCTQQANLDMYNRRFYARRQHFRDMFHESQQYLASHPSSIRALLEKFGLLTGQSGRVWLSRMGKYMGAMHQHKIIAHMQPYRTVLKANYKQSFIGSGNKYLRIFVGGNWGDVLVIPMHCLPGFISGWLFIGRFGREEDFVFYPAYGFRKNTVIGSGLAMYDVLHAQVDSAFSDTVFVFNDVMLALKIQARHLRDSSKPMPILGMYATTHMHLKQNRELLIQPTHSWDSMPQREYIFWSQTPSASLYNAASRANGRVCIAKYADHAAWRSPKRLLLFIKQQSHPWVGSLEMTLRDMTDTQRDLFLEELNLQGPARNEFLYSCTEGTKALLAASEGSTVAPKKVIIGKVEVIETPHGWFLAKTGSLVSDAVLHIEKVIYQEENDSVWYQGYITYHGKHVQFVELAETVDTQTIDWMRKLLVKENVGVINYCKQWNNKAVQLAMHFHPPELVHTTGIFGWDPVKTAFVLPNMQIHLGGNVTAEPMAQVTAMTPATNLTPPDMIMPDLATITVDNEENGVFWATAACVLANVLAPALNEAVTGIGLYGAGAVAIGRITASNLGCATYKLDVTKSGVDVINCLRAVINRHHWPIILQIIPTGKHHVLSSWLNSVSAPNVVLDVNHTVADALAVQAVWRFIRNETPMVSGNNFPYNGPLVAAHWLVSICERGLTLNSNATGLARRVLDDLAAWVAERHGDGEVVSGAVRLLDEDSDTPTTQATRLVSLLYHFIEAGKLTIKREGYDTETTKQQTSLWHIENGYDKQVIFVARGLLTRLLTRNAVPVPDAMQLTDVLTRADCLIGVTHNNVAGWLIDADWWNTQLRLWRANRQQRLKVI